MKYSTFLRSGVAPAILCASFLAPLAYANDVPADANEDANEIIVTGTRIKTPAIDSPNPIIAVTGEQFQNAGNASIVDKLTQVPALIGSQGSTLSAGLRTDLGFGETGVNLLDLRNLGRDRTLVLVNGHRHVAGIPDTAAVDIDSIPQDLIDRVDVLTGGASAIYGADGVSGVVNFVLKRNFEGLSARLQQGISGHGDGHQFFGSITAGTNFAQGRGNIAVAYEYNKQQRIDSKARDYLGDTHKFFVISRDPTDFPDNPNVPDRIPTNDERWADSAPDGAIDLDLDGVPDFTGSGLPYDGGFPLPGAGGRVQGGSSTQIAGYYGDIVPMTEKHSVNMLSSYEFSDAARLSLEAKYVQSKAFSIGQPGFDFFTYLAPDNAYLNQRFGTAASANGALMSRDNFDIGQRGESSNRKTFRTVLGLEGDLNDHAHYEVSYVYGQTKSRVVSSNNRIKDRYYAALASLIHDARFRARSGHLLRLAVLRGRPASLAFVSPHSD